MADDPVAEAVGAWMAWAAGDLLAAERCRADLLMPAWVIGFHCQQAIEKALKAQFLDAAVEPPRIHDLLRLNELVRLAGLPQCVPDQLLEALLPFAVADRYPVLSAPVRMRDEVDTYVDAVGAAVREIGRAVQAG